MLQQERFMTTSCRPRVEWYVSVLYYLQIDGREEVGFLELLKTVGVRDDNRSHLAEALCSNRPEETDSVETGGQADVKCAAQMHNVIWRKCPADPPCGQTALQCLLGNDSQNCSLI
jgi:hypothetical protein